MHIKNAWYVACSAEELSTDKPLGRTVCGEPMVFFLGPGGEPVALEDWCPHRGAPLSLGKVCNGVLTCGYHGLQMGCEGKAIAMPNQNVANFAANRRFACTAYAGFVWVWPGDFAKASLDTLPKLAWADEPEHWAYGGGYYAIACDYRLMIDNLMDLSHETYVHANSIGQREIDDARSTTRTEGEHVVTSRHMFGIEAPPCWKFALEKTGLPTDQAVDRWQVCHFTPPSHVHIEVGVALAGHGGIDAPNDLKTYAIVVDFITPETDTSIHYFWGMARKFLPQSAELTNQIRDGQAKIFAEDRAMLEGQQHNQSHFTKKRVMGLSVDVGGIAARRIIERRIAAEAGKSLAE